MAKKQTPFDKRRMDEQLQKTQKLEANPRPPKDERHLHALGTAKGGIEYNS